MKQFAWVLVSSTMGLLLAGCPGSLLNPDENWDPYDLPDADEPEFTVTLESATVHEVDPHTGRPWDTLGGLPDPCIMIWGVGADFDATAIKWNAFEPTWNHRISQDFKKSELATLSLTVLDEEEEGNDDDEDSGDDSSGDADSDDESSDDHSSDDDNDDDSSDERNDDADLIAELTLDLTPLTDAGEIFVIQGQPGQGFDTLTINVQPKGALGTNTTP